MEFNTFICFLMFPVIFTAGAFQKLQVHFKCSDPHLNVANTGLARKPL